MCINKRFLTKNKNEIGSEAPATLMILDERLATAKPPRLAGAAAAASQPTVADSTHCTPKHVIPCLSLYKTVGGMETTYVSMTDQTDRPTDPDLPPPVEYLSVRITDAHTNWSKIRDVILDFEWYISYAEHGTSGTNPHFHVLLPGSTQRDSDRIRKRLKTAGYIGNRQLSVKLNQNGLSSGIQYCSKEGPPFEIGGDSADVHRWIAAAPKWVPIGKNIGAYLEKPEKKPRNPDHFYMITYQNIEKVTLRYRKENGIKSIQLEDTLAAMHKDGWRCCLQMIKQGIPVPFYDQFTASCKGESIFSSNRFAMMRRPVDYQAM